MGKSGRIESTSKVVQELAVFYLGGGVVVGILSLVLRTSTACEIYSSHSSDCEEHVFWHVAYISTRPHSITSPRETILQVDPPSIKI